MNKYNITKKFLIQEYIKTKKTEHQIARMVRCSQATICIYLKKYKIKTRTQSEATKGKLKKRKHSIR